MRIETVSTVEYRVGIVMSQEELDLLLTEINYIFDWNNARLTSMSRNPLHRLTDIYNELIELETD